MPQSQSLNLQEIVRSAIETPHERADILLLARNLRARAEEALALAEMLDTPSTRQTMRGIAATYEKLAQRLEEGSSDADKEAIRTRGAGRGMAPLGSGRMA